MSLVVTAKGRKQRKLMKVKPKVITLRTVKSIVGRQKEDKFMVTDTSAQALTNAGYITPALNCPIQATTVQNDQLRNGDRIYNTQLYIRGVIYNSASANSTAVRVLIIQWRPNSAPAIASCFVQAMSTTRSPFAYRTIDNKSLFKVLSDKTFVINGQAQYYNSTGMAPVAFDGVPGTRKIISHKFVGKHLNKDTQFLAGSATVGTNLIYMIVIPQAATGFAMDLTTTCRFTDS